MLVLSRKKNESIVIGDGVSITVVEIRGDKVRLGIVAPAQMPVHRQEVFDAIHGHEPYQSVAAPEPAVIVEVSLDQLVHALGATDAEVNRQARFTSEGGIPGGE